MPDAELVDDRRKVSLVWAQLFTLWGVTITAARQSGTTADRPTKGLWVGRRFYDTTLGKPVFVDSIGPVVWHDASGAVV